MAKDLNGKRIAFLVAPSGVEQVELTSPWRTVLDDSGTATLVSTEPGEAQAFNADVNAADTFRIDATVPHASSDDYDALVLPGGTTNADRLRLVPEAVEFVKGFVAAQKPVAAICHGPWALVEAGVLPGKTLTSFPSLQTDIRNAGGTWVDEEAYTCGANGWTLVSSRNPNDLQAFTDAMVKAFQ